IPYGQGLVKNAYAHRTFIAPSQELRSQGVRRKLNPLKRNVAGKRLVVVDDSIVRGTTQRAIARMLREAGASEVHVRITSPPYKWPCFYGVDTGTRAELLAANMSVSEMQDYLGVDSLAFLGLESLERAVGAPGAGFCNACLTGNYPTELPVRFTKGMLESDGADPGPDAYVDDPAGTERG
ncbi:MAG: amidophosphoribosyltransferase, partial [Acidimicrobiales bacterium]